MERLYEALGITGRAGAEFNTANMASFNEVCEDSRSVDYYSIGAKKTGRTMSKILR